MNIHDLTPSQIGLLLIGWGSLAVGAFIICVAAQECFQKFQREQWFKIRRNDGPHSD